MAKVYVIGTFDTKEAELTYAGECLQSAGAAALLVDVSTGSPSDAADVPAGDVARCHPGGESAVLGQSDRGTAVAAMGEALSNYLISRDDIGAVLGLGGSGNTAIVTAAMRTLPVGVPKIMVSTMASGDVSAYVGPNDIAMMYSVVDIAGLNAISRQVIANAAYAAAGMALNRAESGESARPALGFTMFGVTTPCITAIRSALEADFECFVFHATGTGGQSMEKLVDSGLLGGVFDITTTEVCDYLVGGVLPCTPDRFGAVIRSGVPYVGSVGAVDMVNFGARETVPEKFQSRRLHVHNPQITLMRTTAEENQAIGAWIVDRVNRMTGPVRFLLPLKGVSAIDKEDQPFHDPEADEALFDSIRRGWINAPNRKLVEVDAHINDDVFTREALRQFRSLG